MNDIYSINKQINEKTGADTGGATTFELVKAQVAKLGGDISKVVDIRTGEQQVLEHIKPAGPDIVIQTSKDVSISSNGTTVVSPDAGYDAIKDVVVDVNVPDPELEELSVTSNGTYTPDKYGYSKVEVAVPQQVADLYGFDEIGYTGSEEPMKSGVAYAKQIKENWNPNTTSAERKFYSDTKLFYMPKVDTSNVTTMSSMFYNCSSLSTVPLFDTSNVTDMSTMFDNCLSLSTVPLFDTSNVTTMSSMFFNCSSLQTVPLFDTSNVTDMSSMFANCSSLSTVPLFDTSNVTNMSSMFYKCSSLSTVPLFDTSNVTDMSTMFSGCSSLSTVPLFDTSNVTAMFYMFEKSSALTTIPQLDTSKVTSMVRIFNGCRALKDVPMLDASNVKMLYNEFFSCSSLTNFGGLLNIGKGFTSSPTNAYNLTFCSQLTDESIQNVINGLYDMTSKEYSPKLTFESTVYAKLTDAQKAQITAKNWTVTA